MKVDLTTLPVVRQPPDERQFWRKLTRVLAAIPFAEDLIAAWFCARDPATPGYVRAVLFGAIAYFLMPIDLVADYLVGVGFTDDAAVIAMVLSALGRNIAPAHREAARRRLAELRNA
ncbi:MAG: YkvA family protein [Geminicoccaceae bacterium]